LLADEQIFTEVISPKESPTICNCSNQEEKHHDKCAHDQRSDSHWRHQSDESQVVQKTSLILVDHGVKVIVGLLS